MTPLRAVALGDLHLTSGPRNDDRLAALDYVIGDAQRDGPPDLWLWPGDLSHAGLTIALRNLLSERAIRMANVAPVVVVPGNHDPAGDLVYLALLRAAYPIYVVTRPMVLDVPYRGMKPTQPPVALFCLPYPQKAGLVGAGVAHDRLNEEAARALTVIFTVHGETLAQARSRGQLTGAIGHISISGAVASTGQPQIGTELQIDDTHLRRLGPCFQVFNHIHKHQRVGSAVYPGSLCRLDWGETEPKGYLEIIAGRKAPDRGWVEDAGPWGYEWRCAPVPVVPMYHIEGTLTRDRFDGRVTKGPGGPADAPPEWWSGCDLRVRASYPAAERDVLTDARARVAALFPGVRRFEFEPVQVPEHALRAPQVVAARTMEDKLRAWADLTGVAWSDRIAAAAARLLATEDGDAVVADVERDLAAAPHPVGV